MDDVVLYSLIDAIRIHNDMRTGNAELHDVKDATTRFIRALTTLIDERINDNIEERKKLKSQERVSIRVLTALNTAPPPLEEVDLDDPDYVREWFAQYKHWYEKRKSALTNG